MKKTLFLLFSALISLNIYADGDNKVTDAIQVVPFTAEAGITENDYDESHCFELAMVNTHSYTALQLDLYLPEGMSLQTAQEVWDANPDRFDGITKKGNFIPYHTFDITPLEGVNGGYKVIIYDEDLGVIKGESGTCITFYYLTSPDMKPGTYPIYVKNVVLGIDGHNGVYPQNSVSFVTIEGESGANSILDLEDYMIPPFVEEALPTYNVVKNGVCESLYITDKAPFYNTKEFTAKKALYKREATGYNWGTICLPFEIYSNDDLSLQALQSISGNTMEFSEVPSTIAYAPYAYCTPEPTALNISVENVTVPVYVDGTYGVAPIVMKSVMKEPVTLETGSNAYYIANDQFWTPTVNPVNVAPMRAYYDIEGAGAKCFAIEGVSTAINGTEAGAAIEGVYNANGAAQKGMKKGVNLVKYSDGTTQKIIIK